MSVLQTARPLPHAGSQEGRYVRTLEVRAQPSRAACKYVLTCCEKRMYYMPQRSADISAAVCSMQRVPEAPKIQARLDLTSSVAIRADNTWPLCTGCIPLKV